jgi:hypothetical protein
MLKLKVFGLALLAVCAVGAVAASAAFANYDGEVETTELIGTQVGENVFKTDVGNVQCTTATFSGSQKGTLKEAGVFTSATVTVHPVYGGGGGTCKLAGQKVTVNTEGCNYQFDEASVAAEPTAKATVVCEGKEIIIKDTAGLGCVVNVKSQSPGGLVTFKNEGTGKARTVTVSSGVTGIAYAWTATCPNAGGVAGSNTNGIYEGSVKVEGKAGGEQRGIWVT